MEKNFTDKEIKDIICNIKRVEPNFENWSDEKLRDLIHAVYKCGYRWEQQDKDIGFYHPLSQLILNFKGLDIYSPDQIIDSILMFGLRIVWKSKRREN